MKDTRYLVTRDIALTHMNRDQLMEVWKRYQAIGKRKDALELIGDRRPRYTILAANVGAWASNRSAFLFCKDKGDDLGMDCYKRICEMIENELGKAGIYIT